MQLQVISELAKRVPVEAQKEIAVHWKEMSGLRDLVAHQYFSLDIPTIWKTATESAPLAREKITTHLKSKE